MHEQSDKSGGKQEFRNEKSGSIVEVVTNSHGHVNDDIPPRDEGCEVIKCVVVIHGVREHDGEEVEPNENRGDPVEAVLTLLVVCFSQRRLMSPWNVQ